MLTLVDWTVFDHAFSLARQTSERIEEATSPFVHDDGDLCYLETEGWTHGFVVRADCELTNVFSVNPGHGDEIVTRALAAGATHLDCFDGYLPGFYARHGFVETSREPNWTDGEPDVVFMALPAGSELHR